MRAVTGQGCNKAGVQVRNDLPLHDMTGGNYWAADAIRDQNTTGHAAPGRRDDGRAARCAERRQGARAAATATRRLVDRERQHAEGHEPDRPQADLRLPRGPAHVAQRASGTTQPMHLLREDGTYGPITVTIDGVSHTVQHAVGSGRSEHEGIRGALRHDAGVGGPVASALGYSATLPLAYDRVTGTVTHTLGDLASQAPWHARRNFPLRAQQHGPQGQSHSAVRLLVDEARKRNALPVPASQYGGTGAAAPTPTGTSRR